MTVAEPFGLGEAGRSSLRRIARDFGVELVRAGVAAIDASARRVVLTRGDSLSYGDALVLAPGARMLPAFDEALTFTGSGSTGAMRALVDELERGRVRGIAFVVPAVGGWTLSLSELALLSARRGGRGSGARACPRPAGAAAVRRVRGRGERRGGRRAGRRGHRVLRREPRTGRPGCDPTGPEGPLRCGPSASWHCRWCAGRSWRACPPTLSPASFQSMSTVASWDWTTSIAPAMPRAFRSSRAASPLSRPTRSRRTSPLAMAPPSPRPPFSLSCAACCSPETPITSCRPAEGEALATRPSGLCGGRRPRSRGGIWRPTCTSASQRRGTGAGAGWLR
jgi:hypothetical protein